MSNDDIMNKSRKMQVIREVNIEAEDFYEEAKQLGDHAAWALTGKRRSQMTGLENIADSAFKTSDVFDYIKRQTARVEQWKKIIPKNNNWSPVQTLYIEDVFGVRLLKYLENDLRGRRESVCGADRLDVGNKARDDEPYLERYIYLLLIRQFVHQMVAQYEFRVGMSDEEEE